MAYTDNYETGYLLGSGAQSTDLPNAPQNDNSFGTSATPDAGQSTVGLAYENTFSGFLKTATNTAADLAKLYGGVESLKYSVANSALQGEIARSNFDLNRTVALGNLDVAKAQATARTSQGIAQARITAATARDIGGTVKKMDWQFIFGAAGFGLAVYTFFKNKK